MDTELLTVIVITSVFILLLLGMLWMAREVLKLKANNLRLVEQINGINNDVVGLCSAAVRVDSRIALNVKQVEGLLNKLGEYEQKEIEALPYHSVIQKVRAGASAQDLVKDCGLSREEAALLIKVHG